MLEIKVETLPDWQGFKSRIQRYLRFPLESRRNFLFRGQASNAWKLAPTIDRVTSRTISNDIERDQLLGELLAEFRQASFGLRANEQHPSSPEEWEFLGRHHGLPTSIIDWTGSPFIAAYFAFERTAAEHVSVWVLSNSQIDWKTIEGLKMDSFEDALRFNIRAAEQRGVSMRVLTREKPVEEILGSSLIRLDVPATERAGALAELDEMLINRRTLFRDLDGAAKLAEIRLGCC